MVDQRYAVSWPDSYLTVAAPVEAEIEVKRSRFRCRLERVSDETQARTVIDTARKEHWEARHHCSAFVLGPPPVPTERSSDDGEPAGTAGAPMLEALRGRHLSDIVAVVTRWFGGTLLGAGGLVRAYTDTVVLACEQADLITRTQSLSCVTTLDPSTAGRVEHALRSAGFTVTGTTYGPRGVDLELACALDQVDTLTATLAALTAGEASLMEGPTRWIDTNRT